MSILSEYSKYSPLFLVDEEHYAEFCTNLQEAAYKKSEFFLREGEECCYPGF